MTKRAGAGGRPVALTEQQALWFELMQFYIREAWLLDERRYKEWLDLFADDVLYFMPRRKNVPRRELHRELTPLGDLAILEEDKRNLEMRVARLDTGMAWAEDPPSRTRHLVTNVVVHHVDPDGQAGVTADDLEVRSAFLVYRNRLEREENVFAGRRVDILRRTDERLLVARRVILLDQSVLQAKNISTFF
jgi:3-phenylpropionate/cinnamic acid dioxygenase small subunit